MIRVYAPASIGNLGIGFDTLGVAIKAVDGSLLGDYINICDSEVFSIKNTGLFHDQLPIQLKENIIFQCWKQFSKILEKPCFINIELEKNVPVSSGLGSSASSIVAILMAMNYYYNNPLNNNQLLNLMGEMEGKISGSIHFDNIAPCFLGGVRIILPSQYNNGGTITQTFPIFDHWIWIVAYPGVKISTMQSRSVLPQQYNFMDCITHSQNLSSFIHACHTKQESLAIACMQSDMISEPYRSKLLPMDLSYIRTVVMKKGAVYCGISGSGPTIFVLCNNHNIVNEVSNWLEKFYLKNDSGFVKVCTIDTIGAHVVTE